MSAPGRSSGSHADALRIAVRCENLKELQQFGIGGGDPDRVAAHPGEAKRDIGFAWLASRPIPRRRFPRCRCGSPRTDRAPTVQAIGSIHWPRAGASSRLLRGAAHL